MEHSQNRLSLLLDDGNNSSVTRLHNAADWDAHLPADALPRSQAGRSRFSHGSSATVQRQPLSTRGRSGWRIFIQGNGFSCAQVGKTPMVAEQKQVQAGTSTDKNEHCDQSSKTCEQAKTGKNFHGVANRSERSCRNSGVQQKRGNQTTLARFQETKISCNQNEVTSRR